MSFEFSEPVHPCRAKSLCKWTGIFEELQTHFWHSSCSMGATPFKGCQIKLLLRFISKPKRCCFCTYLSFRKGLTLTHVTGAFQRSCSCRQQECSSTLTQLFLDGHMRQESREQHPLGHLACSVNMCLFPVLPFFSIPLTLSHHTHPALGGAGCAQTSRTCLCPGTPNECPRGVHVP